MLIENRLKKHTVIEQNNTYSFLQIIDYSKEMAIKYISEHMKNDNTSIDAYFNPNINLEELYGEMQSQLIDGNIFEMEYFIKYKVYYPNIGVINDKNVDYLMIVTLPETKEIITMYPVNYENDIEYKILEEPKVKKYVKVSQIDKFNKKYNL